MAINPNDKLLYAYGSGVVAVIDTKNNKIIREISAPSQFKATDDPSSSIVVNPNTNHVY